MHSPCHRDHLTTEMGKSMAQVPPTVGICPLPLACVAWGGGTDVTRPMLSVLACVSPHRSLQLMLMASHKPLRLPRGFLQPTRSPWGVTSAQGSPQPTPNGAWGTTMPISLLLRWDH